MATEIIKVPDVGSSDPVDVIEVPIKQGDTIALEDTVVVLESDKATIEVPASAAGKVGKVLVKNGDRVKEGDPLLELESVSQAESVSSSADNGKVSETAQEKPDATADPGADNSSEDQSAVTSQTTSQMKTFHVPDLGDIDGAELIELAVNVGDAVEVEQIVAVLESDKATLEIPAEFAGTVKKIHVSAGSKLGTGDALMDVQVSSGQQTSSAEEQPKGGAVKDSSSPESGHASQRAASTTTSASQAAGGSSEVAEASFSGAPVYAGPAVRKLARELGVTLDGVAGSGPKGRIQKEDVHAHVKKILTETPASSGSSMSVDLPEIDFSRWGEVEDVELNKLRKVSAANLHRSWVTIPHVTQHDEADITELEAFRKSENKRLERDNVKLTMMAFLVKACALALQEFPKFNSSLHVSGEKLVQKNYIHIGVAVDTPNGLVVPVVRDADKKGVVEIGVEVAELAAKARDKKLTPADMQGGTFSISSLGGIGGGFFTPIVNWPEVAILGVGRSVNKPHWNGKEFEPRLMVPLSLSYDHRVIDGADAARFITWLGNLLQDLRRGML